MPAQEFASWSDDQLVDLLFASEDRLPLIFAQEISSRDSMIPYLAHIVMEKQSWLAELPEWWACCHATYILGHRSGEEVVTPLLTALRWADAFDCDWVTEVMPSILGRVGPPMIPGLTAVLRDHTAGWSARDLAMKGLASVTLSDPSSENHIFRIIGQRLMDEGEDRVVRQLAGQILLDFRCQEYRMALLKLAREQWADQEMNIWPPFGFSPEDVEWAFKQNQPELWHYQDDWMRFYEPSEIQRRQKRWSKEHYADQAGKSSQIKGQVLPISRNDNSFPEASTNPSQDSEDNGDE